jgi:iron(III) transport system ATP-binding protein
MTARVALDQVSKWFGPTDAAVDHLTLAITPGEVFALIGPSGSGKSSTLRLIAGFERPDSGSISIDGRLVAGPHEFVAPEHRGVGMVFQDYALFPHLSVDKNVRFGLRGTPRTAQDARVAELLRLVELESLQARYPHQLSGGEQQRVALARALAPRPGLLLLDEPLSNLDADLRARTRLELARMLRAAGTTTIMVTHDQQEAFEIGDRVGVLMNGCLEQCGTPEELYYRPASRRVAEFVGQADWLPGHLAADGTTIETELGCFPAADAFVPGTAVDMLVRPETLQLSGSTDGPAVVMERRFQGDAVVYRVRLSSAVVLRSRGAPATLQAGDRVQPSLQLHQAVTAFPRLA